jgi:hypothetical protein
MTEAKFQNLWYVRRGERVSGPFPEKWLRRDLALGRLRPEDEISPDRVSWIPLRERTDWLREPLPEAPADLPEWQEERLRARRRWLDERRLPDRRQGEARASGEEKRRRPDRRLPESAETLLLRQRHAEWERTLAARRERYLGVVAVLLVLLGFTLWAASRGRVVNPVVVHLPSAQANCRAPASPQVNWQGCDKSGAWLRGVDLESANLAGARFNSANLSLARLAYANLAGADLSYANLEGATLQAANLAGADLTYASLRQADLRLADLRGAKLAATELTGARLSGALWTDGHTCAPGSVGECGP